MSSLSPLTESMGWKLYTYLEQFPDHYDVAFSVGPEKVVVKALAVILKASSSVFEREFKDFWNEGVAIEGEGIPLPDFDPVAFKLFLKLMILDTWSVKALKELKLPPTQLLHLLPICQKYEMTTAVRSLTELVTEFFKNFHKYVDTDTEDSLLFSNPQLKLILASDELLMKEFDVFDYACKWAKEQCIKQTLKVTGNNTRLVLGDALYEIRFPLMTIQELGKVMQAEGLLTLKEVTEIVQSMGENPRSNDTEGFMFKAGKRTEKALELPHVSTLATVTTAKVKTEKKTFSFDSVPAGSSTMSVTQQFPLIDTPFKCDGSVIFNEFKMDINIELLGVGFVGPIDEDSIYDVTAQIYKNPGKIEITKKMEKRIYAPKSKIFYFIFDQPVVLNGMDTFEGRWSNGYLIAFSLKGPNTRSLNYSCATKRINVHVGNKEFIIRWLNPQLVEMVYNRL